MENEKGAWLSQVMKLSIIYKDTTIKFSVQYRNRRTFSIQIEPPDKILVISPTGLSEDEIKDRVWEKGRWILKKLREFAAIGYTDQARRFINGELFLYLGKNYPLKIIENKRKIPRVFFLNDKFYLEAQDPDRDRMRRAMEKWYRKEADKFIDGRVEYYCNKVGKRPVSFKVKEQKRRWGSCTSRGDIYFTWRIIMAPPAVLDYLIVHELCQLVHGNHSRRFWQKVGSVLDDFRERRKWLKKYGIMMDL